MITPKLRPTIGDCEACDAVNVEVYRTRYNLTICTVCRDKEVEAETRSKHAEQMVKEFRAVDSAITVKADIHLAKSVPIVELRAAIFNDPQYTTDEQREEAFCRECQAHVLHLKPIVAESRQFTLDKEAEMRTWQVNGQESAGRLRAELRAKYHELNVNYVPTAPAKKQKTTKVKSFMPSTESKWNRTEFYAVLAKYGVKAHSIMIRQNMLKKNISAEQAAREYASMLGLLDES
jgi:hypothetical protein